MIADILSRRLVRSVVSLIIRYAELRRLQLTRTMNRTMLRAARFSQAWPQMRNAAPRLQSRAYADAAVPSDKIRLSLSLPHEALYSASDVIQVNIPATSGDMGVLANHVPSIQQLKAGLVEVLEESGSSKQFFVSGGFAVVQPDSKLTINAIEAYPLADFSSEAVRNQLSEAQRAASGSGSEQDIAEARIEVEVLEALQSVVK